MNIERIISHTKYRLAGLLAAFALLAAGCTADEDTDAPYLYFGEEIESLSYTVNGGSLTVEMYSNMGPWVIEPAYTGDEEWIDIWPNEGNDSGRFTVSVSANEGAYTRYSTVNVVIGGRVVKSFEVTQSGVEPSIALDMGSDHITAASKGGTIIVPLKANVGWKPLTLESSAGWIAFGESTGEAQELVVSPNTGDERTGVVRFQAIGTNLEKLYADLTIVQFNTAQDPNNGQRLTIADAVARYANAGKITDNVWVEGYVTSNREKRNFDLNVMTLQDDSRRGLLFEFASTNDNTYKMNERLKVHLLGQQLVTDATTRSLKVAAFTSNSVFERDDQGTGIAPVELESISELANYENTLVTLKKVEFAQPAGTYCNIDERYTQSTPSYATIAYNATAMPFCDGNDFYGHLLRDEEGNTCKLYTTTWFLDRFATLIPEGSGPLTGIVTKYYKQSTGEVYIIRLRQHEDNRVSADASTRMSKTLIQFGPFDDANTYDKLTPRIGSGQLTTTMWSAVQAGAGGISMDWGWSYARMAPATVTVKDNGSQSISPALSNSYTNFNILACVSCQYFWDCTASTMNRTDAPEGYKGECWVFHVNDFTPDASKDLYLTFALASSQTGPMYFDIEWGEEENGPLSAYTKIGEIISPDWYSCHQLQQFILKLPDEMKNKQKFTIRFRVTENWNAGNGMVNGSSTESTTVAKGGAPRISFWQIAEI